MNTVKFAVMKWAPKDKTTAAGWVLSGEFPEKDDARHWYDIKVKGSEILGEEETFFKVEQREYIGEKLVSAKQI